MWKEGTIGIPKKEGGYAVVHYWAKVYKKKSRYGIDGGRISKLTLKVKGEVIYNYDRGKDILPQNEAAEKALAILLYEFN